MPGSGFQEASALCSTLRTFLLRTLIPLRIRYSLRNHTLRILIPYYPYTLRTFIPLTPFLFYILLPRTLAA